MNEKYYDVRLTELQVRALDDVAAEIVDGLAVEDETSEFWDGIRSALNVIPCPLCNPIPQVGPTNES
jgi:hypothetical protein